MRRTTHASIAVAAMISLVLSACTPSSEASGPPEGQSTSTVTVTDGAGLTVTLDEAADSVVCLDGTCIDALAELELEPVASVQMDQVTNPIFFGPDVETTALGGSFFEPDIEGIIAAQPDLVIGSASVHGELAEALGDIPLYLNRLESSDDAVTNLERVAIMTGRESQAETAIARFEDTRTAYGPGERESVALSMYGGATSDIGIDALDSATGRLLADYTAYPWPAAGEGDSGFLEIGVESILEVDPDYIWVLDFGFDPEAPSLLDQLADDPIWSKLTAVRTGSVFTADSTWWGTTAGTRGQQAVLDTVMPTMYPEEFPQPLGIMK